MRPKVDRLTAAPVGGSNEKNACISEPGCLGNLLGLVELCTLGFARHPGAQTDTSHTELQAGVEAGHVPDIVPASHELTNQATWVPMTDTDRADKGKPVVSIWERSFSRKDRLADGRPS